MLLEYNTLISMLDQWSYIQALQCIPWSIQLDWLLGLHKENTQKSHSYIRTRRYPRT